MNPTNQGAGEGVENQPQIIRQDKERQHRIVPQNQFRAWRGPRHYIVTFNEDDMLPFLLRLSTSSSLSSSLMTLKFRQYQHETHTNKQKNPQGVATFRDDAIIIFPPISF